MKFPNPNPFQESEAQKVAATAFLYRRFDFGDGIKVVARTEVHGFRNRKGKKPPAYMFVRALNEYDPKITGGWRKVLETQKAGAFATEHKNNICKFTKWLAQAHLAGAQEIRLGWISRTSATDSSRHVILDQSEFTVEEFTREVADGTVDGLWGSLKNLLDSLSG